MYTHPTALRCRKQAMELDQKKVYSRRVIASKCQISHTTFYKFLDRFKEHGEAGLYDKERVPGIKPNQTPPDVEEAILAFVQGHPAYGPRRISAELRKPQNGGIQVGETAVYGVLRRNGLNTRREHAGRFPVERMCRVLKVSRTAYYHWLKRLVNQRRMQDEFIKEQIVKIYDDDPLLLIIYFMGKSVDPNVNRERLLSPCVKAANSQILDTIV